MCYKIWCDGESWKVFGFWGELNKAMYDKHNDTFNWTVEGRPNGGLYTFENNHNLIQRYAKHVEMVAVDIIYT